MTDVRVHVRVIESAWAFVIKRQNILALLFISLAVLGKWLFRQSLSFSMFKMEGETFPRDGLRRDELLSISHLLGKG